MVTATTGSLLGTRSDLTDVTQSSVLDRAVDIVMGLADAQGLRALPAVRGDLLMHLATDEGRRFAAHLVIERYGYVSRYPAAFVSLVMADRTWPTGF